MLISFSVENFRSFAEEQTLSLVASSKLGEQHAHHATDVSSINEKVLRTAVLYGANGSGKSSLCLALDFMKKMILSLSERSNGINRKYFRVNGKDKDSTFDAVFLVNEKTYRYGFTINNDYVKEEWLININKNKEKILFERHIDAKGTISFSTPPTPKKVKLLSEIGGKPNQTFLNTIKSTLSSSKDYGVDINNVLNWFSISLNVIFPGDFIKPVSILLSKNEDFLKFSGDFLKNSSTGINYLVVDKNKLDNNSVNKIFSEDLLQEISDDLQNSDSQGICIHGPNGREFTLEKDNEGNIYIVKVQASHHINKDQSFLLDLDDESDGTRRLLQLIPALHNDKKQNTVYIIDEIDRSMHPLLVWSFLQFFLALPGKNQLIVTTHESNLLDLELLRRDEIWFVEKNNTTLSSELYPLTDFKVRTDLEIRKHYLQGRFGAIPFLGNINRLVDSEV